MTNDGVAAIWYPQEDGYGTLILPTDEAGAPMLYDFAIYGYTTGLDYPEGWEPSGDDWWWPPTELDWPIPRGSATAGCWSCAAAMLALSMREQPTYTTLPRATSSRTTSACGAWRTTACI